MTIWKVTLRAAVIVSKVVFFLLSAVTVVCLWGLIDMLIKAGR